MVAGAGSSLVTLQPHPGNRRIARGRSKALKPQNPSPTQWSTSSNKASPPKSSTVFPNCHQQGRKCSDTWASGYISYSNHNRKKKELPSGFRKGQVQTYRTFWHHWAIYLFVWYCLPCMSFTGIWWLLSFIERKRLKK